MSVNSYTCVEDVMKLAPRFIQTTGVAQGELEFHVQDAEDEVNGLLSGHYAAPFTGGNVPPLVRFITRRFALSGYLQSQMIDQNPAVSQWVQNIRNQGTEKINLLLTGQLRLLTASGTIIEPLDDPGGTIWSNTSDFVPTMGIVSLGVEQVDEDRIEYEDDRRD